MNFDSILTDLNAIPKSLLTCLKYYLSQEGAKKLEEVRKLIESDHQRFGHIIFLGHSYNYFASMIPFRYINSRLRNREARFKKSCSICEIDEFITYFNPQHLCSDTVFVFISESGESLQIRQGIEKLKKFQIDPIRIWCVTNNIDSFLAKNSHFVFPINSGTEEIIGTKSYVNAILVLYLLARAYMDKEPLPPKREDEIRQLIFEVKFYGQDWESHTKNLTDFLGEDYNFLYFISKGASMSTSYQAATSCKAFARTFGAGASMGLFLHGPFQLVDDSFRCILIVGDRYSIEDTIDLMELITLKLGSGKVILVNNNRELSSRGRGNRNVFVFEHTTDNAYLAPIFEIIVIQYLILLRAKKMGVIE